MGNHKCFFYGISPFVDFWKALHLCYKIWIVRFLPAQQHLKYFSSSVFEVLKSHLCLPPLKMSPAYVTFTTVMVCARTLRGKRVYGTVGFIHRAASWISGLQRWRCPVRRRSTVLQRWRLDILQWQRWDHMHVSVHKHTWTCAHTASVLVWQVNKNNTIIQKTSDTRWCKLSKDMLNNIYIGRLMFFSRTLTYVIFLASSHQN